MPRLVPIAAALVAASAAAAVEPIAIGDRETIVIYGDSITEQNLYAAYLETFLISRFPAKELTIYNFGWGGDTARGGESRFARDVGPVKPTLVFVDFGMNDGGYHAPDENIRNGYLDAQRKLAATIAAAGAREVLETTSPIDFDRRPDKDVYNDALAAMADGLVALGAELHVPVIDQFHPLRALQAKVKAERAGFTMIPDSVHPDPVGHLAMAYEILQGIAAPHAIGAVAIDGATIAGDGVADAKAEAQSWSWTMTLPCIPFFVPEAARAGLALVPFERDLNALTLTARGLAPDATYALTVDGVEAATLTGAQLAQGVDLAALDRATWAKQGRELWETALMRWQRHYDAWRKLGFEQGPTAKLASFAALRDAESAFVRELGARLREIAQPRPYHVALARQNRLVFAALELSPVYPWDGDFDKTYAPETDPDHVAWKPAALTDGALDLLSVYPGAAQCVVYARARLHADTACTVRFAFGSDDGLAVLLDGKRIHAHNVMRGLKPGEDVVETALTPGDHVLLLRVTQGNGGMGVAVGGDVLGDAAVTVR